MTWQEALVDMDPSIVLEPTTALDEAWHTISYDTALHVLRDVWLAADARWDDFVRLAIHRAASLMSVGPTKTLAQQALSLFERQRTGAQVEVRLVTAVGGDIRRKLNRMKRGGGDYVTLKVVSKVFQSQSLPESSGTVRKLLRSVPGFDPHVAETLRNTFPCPTADEVIVAATALRLVRAVS
jgi:hypothetical protein